MEKKWTRSVRSMIALLLCAAMLLPMLPQVVVRADTTGSTSGFSDTIVAGGTKTESVTTATPQFKLEKVKINTDYVVDDESYTSATKVTEWLFQGHSYAVGSEYGNSLLSYSAAGQTTGTADGTEVAGFTKFDEKDGVITFDPIYRDEVLWKLTQDSAWSIEDNKPFSPYTSDGKTLLDSNSTTGKGPLSNYYPFTAAFQGFVLEKGTGGYWYSTTSDAYRYLNLTPSSSEKFSTESGSSASNRIEYYGDGVFQIFYAGSANPQSNGTYRMWEFLRCGSDDANVTTKPWLTAGINQSDSGTLVNNSTDSSIGTSMKNDELWTKRLRLNLYHYTELDTMRTLSYSGYDTYYVMQGESAESILAKIQENITLEDTYKVTSSGRTAKVGYYWLDTEMTGTPEAEEYTVTVKYHNDNGTNTVVDTITVKVENVELGTPENGDPIVGYISKNSLQSAYVFDGVASGASAISVEFGESNLPITVNMLYTSYTDENVNTRLDVTKPGRYTDVKVVSGTREIGTMTIVIANGTIAAHTPVSPDKGSVDVDKSAYVLNSVTDKGDNLANIQLSALGTEKETGVDLIVVLDLSSSMRYGSGTSYEVCGPYRNYKNEANTTGYTLNKTTNEDGSATYSYSLNVKYKNDSSTYTTIQKDSDGNVRVKADNSSLPYTDAAWINTRMYDLEVALQSMIETLQENNTDVQIAITDFGDLDHYEFTDAVIDSNRRVWPVLDSNANNQMDYTYELTNHLNFVLGRDDYGAATIQLNDSSKNWVSQPFDLHEWKYWSTQDNGDTTKGYLDKLGVAEEFQGKQAPMIYTGEGSIDNAFTDVHEINLGNGTDGGIIEQLRISNSKMLGTNYDVGLEYAYKLAYERQQANIAAGEDREIMCVFMSDGAAMQYNYFSGRSITDAWSEMITGDTDEVLTNHGDAANFALDYTSADIFVDYESLTPKLKYVLGNMHRWLAKGNSLVDHNDGGYLDCTCKTDIFDTSNVSNMQENGKALLACMNSNSQYSTTKATWYDIFRDLYKNPKLLENAIKDYHVAVDDVTNTGTTWTSGISSGETKWLLKGTGGDTGVDAVYYPRNDYGKSGLELIKELTTPNNSTDAEENTTNYEYQTMSPYYYFYNADGKNWWAEAIKGDTDKVYPVINKYAKGETATGATNPNGYSYNGEIVGYNDGVPYYDGFSGTYYENGVQVAVSEDNNTTYYTDSSGNRQALALSGKDYISGFQGLGMRLYTVGFAIATENLITAEEANTVLQNLASGPNYYYSAANRNELSNALNSIVGEVTQGATFGYFTDTMGEEFDLYTRFTEDESDYEGTYYDADGVEQDYDVPTADTEDTEEKKAVIRVFKADKTANVTTDVHQVTNTQYTPVNYGLLEEIEITKYGEAKSIVYEYVTNTDGSITTKKIETDDVWDETRNIIQGTYVVYNLNKTGTYLSFTKTGDGTFTDSTVIAENNRPSSTDTEAITAALYAGSVIDGTVMINLDSDAELDYRLEPETFFWTIGNIPQDYRIVLEYQAYMEESYAGTLPLKYQYYDTNEQATLTYVDYLGNLVTKDTVSPELPWQEQALYKYAYYKVNVNGQPVDEDGNETNDPAQYVYFTNNGQYYTGVVSSVDSSYTGSELITTIANTTVSSNKPDGYVLYDSNAGVTITTTLAYAMGDEDGNLIKVPDKHTITPNAATQGLIATTLVKDTTAAVSDIENGKLRNNVIYFAVYLPPEYTTIQYSFYLVDESGTPVDKTGTPTTNGWSGAFKLKDNAGKVTVTLGENPETLQPADRLKAYCDANGLEASLFEIYDASATAVVDADLSSTASHKVTLSKDTSTDSNGNDTKVPSTYIDTATTDPSNTIGDHTIIGADALTTTEVSFAVKLKSQAEDDVIVVDFGLPVNISVLANDKLTSNLTLNGINSGAKGEITAYNTHDGNYGTEGFGEQYGSVADITDGDAVVNYTPTTMSFDGYDLFSYEAKYTSKVTGDNGEVISTEYFYTANVTVIPATIIYYEDNVTDGIKYDTYTVTYVTTTDPETDAQTTETVREKDETSTWTTVGTTSSDWEQDEDRPGTGADGIDADNVYGMDSHYKSMAQYSMGSAHMVHVDAGKFATAQFDFTGTGFDVISLTDNTTGTIMVTVYEQGKYDWENPNTGIKAAAIVDTFYGYTYSDGIWTPSSESNVAGRLYQVPVIKMSGLEYGNYTAVITVTYMEKLDQTAAAGYDFYLDAIRIYDPANEGAFTVGEGKDATTDTTIRDAYIDDGEGWPEYFELRNLILSTKDLDLTKDNTVYNGVVFIDKGANTNEFAVSDYHNYGPNNELYLAPDQSIAFDLAVSTTNLAGIHMAVKSVSGTAKLTYKTPLIAADAEDYVSEEETINSATDLYYDISSLNGKTVLISNTGTGILSITNVKVTYTADTSNNLDTGYLSIATSNVVDVLEMMGDEVSDSGDSNDNEGSTGSEKITIKSASLSLAGKVYVNYYFTVGDLTINIESSRVTNAGLLIWNSDPGDDGYDTEPDIKVVGAFTTDKTGRYVAQTPGIAAKDLGNTLYTCVYVVDEDEITHYSEVRPYSPRTYAYNMLNRLENSTDPIKNADKLKQLCAALLNYGAAAQVYFDANEVPLANNELYKYNVTVPEYSDVVFTSSGATDSTGLEESTGFGEAWISTSFSGALALNFYFKPKQEPSGNITMYYWDNDETVLTMENAKTVTLANTGNGTYSYTLTDITSKEIGDKFYAAAVYTVGNTEYCTGVVRYSVYDYCVNKVLSDADYANATDNNKYLSDLAEATAVYGYCAKQYFDAVSQ